MQRGVEGAKRWTRPPSRADLHLATNEQRARQKASTEPLASNSATDSPASRLGQRAAHVARPLTHPLRRLHSALGPCSPLARQPPPSPNPFAPISGPVSSLALLPSRWANKYISQAFHALPFSFSLHNNSQPRQPCQKPSFDPRLSLSSPIDSLSLHASIDPFGLAGLLACCSL